uniref:stress response protein NST1 n=1 Tax=Bombus vancouverensis nearcticus TaxID=2705178 RepID=UPI00143AB906|nr:stress response protein NST1 [Bombus vancouverensis nearcticus]
MLPQEWLLVSLLMGSATALAPMPHHSMEESLRSALDAITRKQRSLDTNSQDYYNDLRSFKYHGGEGERKLDRERQGEREIEEEDEEIEFLPNETGQLETVGNGFQDLNNKLLERALIDYLENVPQQQEQPVTSLFRERERGSNRKRGYGSERSNIDNKELAKLFLEELQDGSPYNLGDADDEGYMDSRQMLYDRYRGDRGNKIYENSGPMSWGALLNKESMARGQSRESEENDFGDREQDPNLLYLSMGERRNMNGGYSIGRPLRTYRNMAKRYLVAKRSPKPVSTSTKKQITDPKVAQDLGALFGTQSVDNQNHTHNFKHDHSHDHDHDHDHNHDHDHDHEHGDQHKHESSSEAPKVTPSPKGQKENVTKLGKSKSIEVRKKSVDWSQYFGIDRRKKKATFMVGQGTPNQDDEWMLQRYYENMVENLKANDREYEKEADERKDRLDQLDPRQKTIKDLIIEEALKYRDSENGIDMQKVKDKIMARIASAYSFEKMRKALNELRNNVATRIEAQKATHVQSNQTSNFRENSSNSKSKDKRINNLIETEAMEENRACPELELIERRCRTVDTLGGDESQMLYLPCVMLQICKACVQNDLEEECLGNYAVEAGKICDAQEIREGPKSREACASTALILSQLQTPTAISDQCRLDGNDSCLRRYHYQYWHRYLTYPYNGRRLNSAYDMTSSQQSDR